MFSTSINDVYTRTISNKLSLCITSKQGMEKGGSLEPNPRAGPHPSRAIDSHDIQCAAAPNVEGAKPIPQKLDRAAHKPPKHSCVLTLECKAYRGAQTTAAFDYFITTAHSIGPQVEGRGALFQPTGALLEKASSKKRGQATQRALQPTRHHSWHPMRMAVASVFIQSVVL